MFQPHVELSLSTNNSTIIKATVIFAEGIFNGETHVIHPPISKLKSILLVPLFLPKDSPVDIHVKVSILEAINQALIVIIPRVVKY